MKKMILALTAGILSMTAMAQQEQRLMLSGGAELSIPTGSFGRTHQLGVGASAEVALKLKEKLYGTGYVGVLVYRGNDNPEQAIIPIKVGVKQYLVGNFYAGAQIGVGIFNNARSSGSFAYTPLIGYNFRLKNNNAFDATFKYDGYSTGSESLGAVGLRVAYVF